MGLILCLETATKMCSVSLASDGKLLNSKSHYSEKFSHAERLNGLILSVLEEVSLTVKDLDAVAVSEGPGSYTGLRIGTSTAKGLCYALNIPLIAVNSLKALAASKKGLGKLICPLFDARRMEVYSAVFDSEMNEVQTTEAVVIDEHSYQDILDDQQVVFLGPGAEKCIGVVQNDNATFDTDTQVSADGMVTLASERFSQGDFADLAYFEPFYLKDFIAGKPKKMF
jgi:tRNA threonylcarbamoyladenosine biosynthesis protein TsaB